jgi:PhoH-like ATPase
MNEKVMTRSQKRTPGSKKTRLAQKVVPIKPGKPFGASKIPVPMPTQRLQNAASKTSKQLVVTSATKKRTYVLDTNVLMHDPSCLFHFKEHDIVIPFMVLEELDNNKKGHEDKSRNARQVSRTLESLFENQQKVIDSAIPLEDISNGEATGKLSIQASIDFEKDAKPDNVILEVVKRLKASIIDHDVVLVSKDINMRLKARTMGLLTEDYTTDLVEAKDGDYFHPGHIVMPNDFWETHGTDLEARNTKEMPVYTVRGKDVRHFKLNQFIVSEGNKSSKPFAARVVKKDGNTCELRVARNYETQHDVYKVHALNHEQNFALNLLVDPDIDFVSLTGIAGTGKTLLALAAGLHQVFDTNRYGGIIFTRATVSVGEDIGFLPGTEEEKMAPWFGALYDNLEALTAEKTSEKDSKHGPQWGKGATDAFIRSRIKILSMALIRGRTFVNQYIIIDEAQNLTPKQVKTFVTRAGEGTKIVLMGNLAQIDTPYLTEGSCGLTYIVNRFQDKARTGHITLVKGERSYLADLANEVL